MLRLEEVEGVEVTESGSTSAPLHCFHRPEVSVENISLSKSYGKLYVINALDKCSANCSIIIIPFRVSNICIIIILGFKLYNGITIS